MVVEDSQGNHMALFASSVALDKAERDHPDIAFEPLGTGLARRVAA